MEEVDDSESEGDGEREVRYVTSTHVRKDDSGLEDELEYFWEVPSPSDPYEREEDRWWSPGPPEPSSEEDEEEVRYLTKILGLGPKGDEAKGGGTFFPNRDGAGHKGEQPGAIMCRAGQGATRSPQRCGAAPCKEDQKKETQKEGDEGQGLPVGASEAGCLVKGDAHRQLGK
jgi:hypothetical protein